MSNTSILGSELGNSERIYQKYWTDIITPLTASRIGANNKPDFDATNIGFLFPYSDVAEILYLIVQFPHGYSEGTNIRPHLHWQQSNASAPKFKLDYKWFNNGEAVPSSFTTIETNREAFSYTSGNLTQISSFPELDGTGKKLSSMFLAKLYRTADVGVNADVLAFQFDIHYQIDIPGSQQEFIKVV
jgi:hypothetical protein